MIVEKPLNPYSPSEPIVPIDPASVPALAEPQSVRYATTMEGAAAYAAYQTLYDLGHREARRSAIKSSLVITAVVVAAACWNVVHSYRQQAPLHIPTLVTFGALALLFLWTAFQTASYRRIVASASHYVRRSMSAIRNPSLAAPQILTITSEGVFIEKPLEKSWSSWQAMEEVVYSDDYLFIVTDSLAAHVIPRTAFASQHEFLGFAKLAKQLWDEYGPLAATAEPATTADNAERNA